MQIETEGLDGADMMFNRCWYSYHSAQICFAEPSWFQLWCKFLVHCSRDLIERRLNAGQALSGRYFTTGCRAQDLSRYSMEDVSRSQLYGQLNLKLQMCGAVEVYRKPEVCSSFGDKKVSELHSRRM